MTGLTNKLLILLLLASPAYAFVEKLGPNQPNGGGIPCHGIGAMLFLYVAPSGPSGSILNSIVQREWVPGGWSSQDITDLENLVNSLNALSAINKHVFLQGVEYYCLLWELDVDEVNSPAEYRTRLIELYTSLAP